MALTNIKTSFKKMLIEMNSYLSSHQAITCQDANCAFERVPREVLSVLFSFLPTTRDLCTLCRTCKRFNLLLREDKKPWEHICLKWWQQNEFDSQIKLEKEVLKECVQLDGSKNWRWLGSCLAHEECANGLSWAHYYDDGDDEHLEFGERKKGELHGWGISLDLNEHIVKIGRFSHGELSNGEQTHPMKYKYVGDFNQDSQFQGWGEYKDLVCGWTYKGHWRDGQKTGKGIMTWPNGFQYQGEWLDDQPKEIPLHPQIKECLQNRKCTSTVTKGSRSFGQYLVKHARGYWCKTCAETCFSKKDTKLLGLMFYPGEECSCLNNSQCHANDGSADLPVKLAGAL